MARRFAARIGVVREAAGIVAYRAGHFSEALSDLRAARRMTGSDAYLPVMADCERGMGRPERALDLVRSPEAERLDRAGRIELTIVESGARRDLGQHDAAVITLQRLPELRDPQPRPWSARLAFAYADALEEAGHRDAAVDWFGRAMAFDEDGETDAAERYSELTGATIEDVEEGFDEDFVSPETSASDDATDEPTETGEAAEPAAPAASEETGRAAEGAVPQDAEGEAADLDASPEPSNASPEPAEASPEQADASPEQADASPEPSDASPEQAEAGSDFDSDSDEGAAEPASEEPADVEPGEAGSEAASADDVAGEDADKPGTSAVPIAPSFIEPDFGDQPDDKPGKQPE
ncbi:hypothetical protein [Nonomuraea sp. NPDC048826]|uniref:hypothetical protein n=1 Tax=Nonomuraea sp. NPDC048826 TaxID=3364347 RepID=UPI003720B9B4